MPSKEIKELRQAGKLDDALSMALEEFNAQPDNIWTKRNLSWVYYEQIKACANVEDIDSFLKILSDIENLNMPEDETLLLDNLAWTIGKYLFSIHRLDPDNTSIGPRIFDKVKNLCFVKPSEGSSFMFKAFHKILKENNHYVQMVDWFGLENLLDKDFLKETLPNGKEMMSFAEQTYIAYAKHLLPIQDREGHVYFDKEKAQAFIIKLSELSDKYPDYQYPSYFQAKLLLAVGDKDNVLASLLPFAKKKRNDFWVWDVLAEAVKTDSDKAFACYCKGLLCKSSNEMLVNLRQKTAKLLISRGFFNEAKTEIEILVKTKLNLGHRIPTEIEKWKLEEWYITATGYKNNDSFYKQFSQLADSIMFTDDPEQKVIVEFVNSDKKMVSFIGSEQLYGFFKYDRFFNHVNIGDVLKVRIQEGSKGGLYKIFTAEIVVDDLFKKQFVREINGVIRISPDKEFGFVDDVFIQPSLVKKLKLENGSTVTGEAMKVYNKDKDKWGWKLI